MMCGERGKNQKGRAPLLGLAKSIYYLLLTEEALHR